MKQFQTYAEDVLFRNSMEEVWGLLKTKPYHGGVDAVYTGSTEADVFMKANPDSFEKKHFKSIGSEGVAYCCRPEFGDVVEALNDGLRKFKGTDAYRALCDRYPSIACDVEGTQWSNKNAIGNIADHPTTRADIVIATEADVRPFNYIEDGMLKGFDIELTREVCKAAGKTCAIVTVPWQSVWPKSFPELGWSSNPKTYAGIGMQNTWFHCTSGTRNTLRRRQSTAFTDSYTDKNEDYAGFVVAKSNGSICPNAFGERVAILESQAYTSYFRENNGKGKLFHAARLMTRDNMQEVRENV